MRVETDREIKSSILRADGVNLDPAVIDDLEQFAPAIGPAP